MEFGISCSKVDDVGLVAHAENLGFDFCWTTDSPMLRSNPWAVLALATQRTRSIKLGMGVAVPGLRLAPDTANGIATINRLAPGRTFLGIGTGNTAMRTLGRTPMKVADFAEYIAVIKGLLTGGEVDFRNGDSTQPIRFQNQHLRYVDVEHPIPIHVGGFGPRAQALAGELGDGLITGIPRGGTIPCALDNVRRGAERVGRTLTGFRTTALANVLLLQAGETLRSERVVPQIGSAIMANVHYLLERHKETGAEPPAYVLPIWQEYLDFQRKRDGVRSNQRLHASHYSYLDAEEARFITPEMITAFCIAGQPEEVCEQLRTLAREGLDAITFIPPDDEKYRAYEDFSRRVISVLKN